MAENPGPLDEISETSLNRGLSNFLFTRFVNGDIELQLSDQTRFELYQIFLQFGVPEEEIPAQIASRMGPACRAFARADASRNPNFLAQENGFALLHEEARDHIPDAQARYRVKEHMKLDVADAVSTVSSSVDQRLLIVTYSSFSSTTSRAAARS